MKVLSRHGVFISVLVVYATILALQIDHGLASALAETAKPTRETIKSAG